MSSRRARGSSLSGAFRRYGSAFPLTRALWFVVVGWIGWLCANVASALAVTVVGLPLAIPMFDRLPLVTSLYRFDG
ncbi:hypothetical protein [Haloplanus sp. HW8-1]|uniref:hypothetical protein n=1 Tax=Haloplanus pelagicus TaxID=2949995 RepID=UPI00204134D8|nr:hypothetical protein [Haloplanus sp. HW8-1]